MRGPWLPLIALAACDVRALSNECLDPGPCSSGQGLLYPLEDGAWWNHREVEEATQDVYRCKLVTVDAEQPIPLRPWVDAFPATSVSVKVETGELRYGVRWQQVDDCSIYRHLDEWYKDAEMLNRDHVTWYCPRHLRVPDCPGACEGASWNVDDCDRSCQGAHWSEGVFWKAELTTDDPELWDACLAMDLDHETCSVREPIEGCDVVTSLSVTNWMVDEVGRQISLDAFGEPFDTVGTAKQDWDSDETGGGWQSWHTYWRARGVGKVMEGQPGVQQEELLDYWVQARGAYQQPPEIDELVDLCW